MSTSPDTPTIDFTLAGRRPDRLPVIVGPRSEALVAEYSLDAGSTWHPATVYPGDTVDEWRQIDTEAWNRSTTEGVVPAGDHPCVWACWFDLDAPGRPVTFRLCAGGRAVFQQDLTPSEFGLLVNHINVVEVAADPLSDPWSLRTSDVPGVRAPSLHGAVQIRRLESEYPTAIVENADHDPLALKPRLDGWHRVYIGFSAWYHSKVIDQYRPTGERFEREDPAQLKWTGWMVQGDPLAVAVDEARELGLRIFADAGMNITYLATDRFHYRAMTGAFAEAHPELMCADDLSFFDYRHEAVREYAAAIVHELLTEYDLDGVHLDFARFAYNKAFDHASLVDTIERVDRSRRSAAAKWDHPVEVSVRIPSYLYHHWDRYTGDFPEFLSALRTWATNGWIDRAMVCCMLPDRLPELSLERYVDALAGTDVKLWGDLYATPPSAPRSRLMKVAEGWCRQGLDGGFFIYDAGRPIDYDDINWQLRAIDSSNKGS